jgi:hypothetical protein
MSRNQKLANFVPCSLLLVIGICSAISMFVAWAACAQVQDIETSDPLKQRIIRESKFIFEKSDRCDPFPCFDKFQVIYVENLMEPVSLANTGAAGIGVQPAPNSISITGVSLIESSRLVHENPDTDRYVCQKGNYVVGLIRRDLLYLPIDNIRVCYRTERATQ